MFPMDAPYWVADYLVDPSRNQITYAKSTVVLQPKVVAVLNVLAQSAGQVVSHDELMQKVWPNTYVGSNTLQRCIAELRKVLGDDSRTQAVIKTHSKQGYSLEVKVSLVDCTATSQTRLLVFPRLITFSLIACLCAFIAVVISSKNDVTPRSFNAIKPLTATDEKEYFPDYSPDGKYMVFHRYLGVCDNHIWAKDLSTQQEFRLTQASAVYGKHNWSADGNQLVFVKQKNCSQEQQVKSLCWELHTLDFATSLAESQPTTKLLDCGSRRISDPQWLDDGRILVLEHSDETRILEWQPHTNSLQEFYSNNRETISHFAVSNNNRKIAVFNYAQPNNYTWVLLDDEGEQLTTGAFQSPESLSVYTFVEPKFSHDDKGFFVNTPHGLFDLSFAGEFTRIPVAHSLKLFEPALYENGTKILATQGIVDADVGLLQLDNNTALHVMARSNGYDVGAIFQPNGTAIAFRSQRSGSSQVWLVQDDVVTQLSHFKQGEWVRSLVWSPDGQKLATIANDTIQTIELDGHTRSVRLGFPVNNIYQWIDENHLLIKGFFQEKEQLLVADINSASVAPTTIGDVLFAHMDSDGTLFFVDQNRKAWVKKHAYLQPLQALNNHLNSKRFVAKQGMVYGVNWQHQLWKYDISRDQLAILRPLPDDVWWINDIRNKSLSVTTLVSSRHEIIELSLSNN